jgi:hypothetical protein
MESDAIPPRAGMTVSIRTRQDVVIMDPERFLAAARAAYRGQDPRITADRAAEAVADVYDAVHVLLDHYGTLASDHPDVAAGGTTPRRMHGGTGVLPGERVLNRRDGLSLAGSITMIVLDEPRPLQDYGCFQPEDPFAIRGRRHPDDAPDAGS